MSRHETEQSSILRLWRATPTRPWQAILVNPATPTRRSHFARLEALAAYLLAQDQLPDPPPETAPVPPTNPPLGHHAGAE